MGVRFNLFNKFIVAFISVGILPVLFISFYSASLFHKQTHTIMEDSYRQAAFYGVRNLDGLIEKYNTISKLLYSYNPDNRDILRNIGGLGFAKILKEANGDKAEQIKRSNDILSFLYLIRTSDPYIANVVFMETGGVYHAFGWNNRPLIDESGFIETMNVKGGEKQINKLKVISTHRDSYFQGSVREVFTIARNYLDLSYPIGIDHILGTLYIDIDVRAIDNLFKQLDVYRTGEILILDGEDNLIFANPGYYANGSYANGSTENGSGSLLEITEYCEDLPWRMVIRADYRKAVYNIADLLRTISIIVTLILTALLVLSVFYSRLFSNPIRAILGEMKKVEAGDFNVHIAVKAHDEIGQLAEGLCEMAGKLEEYIRTSFVARIREKEAELSSLKAKIKPHFLYNSLEIIRMNAIAHDDESTAELALHLAEQMRVSIEWSGKTVSLSRELEMIRGYFAFIDLRYDRRIAWDIHCDPSLGDAQVLSFMIQPIVENAVIHGVKPKGQGRIEISAEVQDRDLKISVCDDGIGMDEAAITKIRRRLEMDYQAPETGGDHDSTGLKNVHDRICYKYGASYGVRIESTPESGTSVFLLVPVLFSEVARV